LDVRALNKIFDIKGSDLDKLCQMCSIRPYSTSGGGGG